MKIDALVLTFLLNALWLTPAALAAGALGARLLHRAPARQRHVLWLAVAAACVLLPAASLPRPDRALAAENPPAARAAAAGDGAAWLDWLPEGGRRPAAFPPIAGSAVLLGYGLLLAARAVRLGLTWSRTNGLARRALPLEVPEHAAPLVARCRKILGIGAVDLLASNEVAGPVTLGALRPAILLPPGFLDGASPEEALSALGHEMAHVRRRDYAVNLLCEALLIPVAFHPAVRLVRRRLAEAREMACDEAVLETLIGRRSYARSLLSLAASIAGLDRPSYTLGVADAHTLEVRMKRILDDGPRMGARRARAALGAALLLLAGIGAAGSVFSVDASVAVGTGDLKPFVGTWSGDWPADKDGKGPGQRAVDLEVRPGGEIWATWYRYEKAADGSMKAEKRARPVASYAVAGKTLTFKVRVEDFKFRDNPPAAAEMRESLELQGRDAAVFKVLSNSYFEAAKKRGEPVPPPPPPISMKRAS
ncbi:MAG TPA: M56 family metallopeptidase [Thermoanaerobaculia bacterium]|nr:M56 family metallopeptidase [Thermoanaerobaculia bacterium]